MPDPQTVCTDKASCAAMKVALGNPPQEGLGLCWELLGTKTPQKAYWPVYFMRRNKKKGDLLLTVSFCPFCGAPLNSFSIDRKEASNA